MQRYCAELLKLEDHCKVLVASEERLLLLLLKETKEKSQLLGPWGYIDAKSYC